MSQEKKALARASRRSHSLRMTLNQSMFLSIAKWRPSGLEELTAENMECAFTNGMPNQGSTLESKCA
eukprot:2232440-Prymnesium_polylepis.1